MEYAKTVLAALGRASSAVWSRIKAVANHVYDPPPKAIKVYFFIWLVSCAVGIVAWNKGFDWVNHRLAVAVGLSSDVATVAAPLPLAAIPELPDVITTVPPPAALPVKEVTQTHEPEKPKAKAQKKAASKRKAKKQAATSDPWSF